MLTARLVATALVLFSLTGPTAAFARPATDPPPTADQPDCIISVLTTQCELSVTDDVHRPGDAAKPGKTTKTGKKVCLFEGEVVPCATEDGFWDAESGCYLQPRDFPSTFRDPSTIKPGSKFYRCWVMLDVIDGKPYGEARIESVIKEPGEPRTIDPRVAAQQVVDSMDFVAPHLGLSPYVQSARRQGIVNTPIWMWVTDPGAHTTGPLTANASLGGVSVNAVGTVDRIEWATGDGQVVICPGAGTPFTRATAAGRSLREIPDSPTCGHRYKKTSRCLPDQTYQVTATVFWNVHWTAGGHEGDIPFRFSRSTPLSVIDLRPVLVAPDNGIGELRVTPSAGGCS